MNKNIYFGFYFQKAHIMDLLFADISSGLFETEITYGATTLKLLDELARFQPSEIICNQNLQILKLVMTSCKEETITLSVQLTLTLIMIILQNSMIETNDYSLWAASTAALLTYVQSTQFTLPDDIDKIKPYQQDAFYDSRSKCQA